MLFLRAVTGSKQCEVNIDYYVPFTINLENDKLHDPKLCWRIGNFKKSLMEISIDEKGGILREITLTLVDKAHLVNTVLENINIVESGTPVFGVEGTIKNGLCDHMMDFDVYLSRGFIMVDFSEEKHPYKFIELERVRFGFDKDSKLISVIIKDLTNNEYRELKNSLKL